MIKQLKMGMKMLRYTFGIKTSLGLGGVLFVLGILFHGTGGSGSYLILTGGLWIVQLLYSLPVSGMIQTSPWKRELQTSGVAIVSFFSFLFFYLIDAVLLLLFEQQKVNMIGTKLVIDGIIILFFMIYCGFAYKFFIVSTILFLVSYFGMSFVQRINVGNNIYTWLNSISLVQGAIIGGILIVLGGLVQYAVSCLVYKCPFDKNSQLRGLQKFM
ncbi:MAG: hypothetical protein IJO85_08745 [Lachnospiraceae bacterium]|nr:hypothetical protein [Lachnospiraceae bacterium]